MEMKANQLIKGSSNSGSIFTKVDNVSATTTKSPLDVSA